MTPRLPASLRRGMLRHLRALDAALTGMPDAPPSLPPSGIYPLAEAERQLVALVQDAPRTRGRGRPPLYDGVPCLQCDQQAIAAGLCRFHYDKARRDARQGRAQAVAAGRKRWEGVPVEARASHGRMMAAAKAAKGGAR